MKDYSLFDMADFVMDEDFIRWVNDRNKADNIFWENWLSRNPNKHLIVAEARRILESIGSEQAIVPPDLIDTEIEKLLQAINIPVKPGAEPDTIPLHRPSVNWKFAAVAAVLIAVLGVSTWIFSKEKKATGKFTYTAVTATRQLIENINTSKNTITVPLPDGSTVKLASNSRISYEDKFDSMATRDVFLSGQAFLP